jgi:hypothetical protein
MQGTMVTDNALQQVIDLVTEEMGPWEFNLEGRTRIEEDLGIMGDDAGELMDAYFKKFKISNEGFEFYPYFHPEGFGPIFFSKFLHRLIYRRPYPPDPVYDLTLNDLARSVREGRWIHPVPIPPWPTS